MSTSITILIEELHFSSFVLTTFKELRLVYSKLAALYLVPACDMDPHSIQAPIKKFLISFNFFINGTLE